MSKFLKITIFASLLAVILLPQVVFAVDCSKGLVKCSRDCNNNGFIDDEERCTLCDVLKMLQNLISTFPAALMVWAGIFIVIGGIAMIISGGAPDKVSQGKRIISSVVLGLVIAFGAWIIINTVMNAIVNPDKMPWPWNRIECVPKILPSGETHKACIDNACKVVEGAGANQCNTDAECAVVGGDKKYCICETPVYDLDPTNFPNEFHQIGTNIKASDIFASQEECKTQCVSANASTYCPSALKLENAKLYCASESEIKDKQTCALYTSSVDCQISTQWFPKINAGTSSCIDNSTCLDLVTPGSSIYNADYAKRCWLDGTFVCRCESKGSGSNPCQLYRYQEEKSYQQGNLWNCEAYGSTGRYCRLNCQYDKCSGGTPATTWRFQSGVEYQTEQTNDATTALTNFLNCFYQKAPNNIGYISAITDKNIYDGTCDPQKCKAATCTIADCGASKPCDHACHSCHYGGTCTSAKSYAVDFGDEENVCVIATAARQCTGVNKIYGPQTCGGKVETDGYHTNHVHVSVINSCGCN